MTDYLLDRILDRPIAFHRVFVDVAGSVLAGLMLSQAFYWSRRGSDPDGWFYKTREEWQEETGMGRYEQETARKRLRATDFWEEERRGAPARLYFRLHRDRLYRSLANQLGGIQPTRWGESNQLDGGNPTNTTETTTEITTETSSSSSGAVFAYYQDNFPGMMTEAIAQELGDFIDGYGEERVLDAMKIAVMAEKRSLRYVNGILRNPGEAVKRSGKTASGWDDPDYVARVTAEDRERFGDVEVDPDDISF